ncbi:MAG: hypothetical protein QG635_1785 [Bacteroidota bacterium]|nr:hypothetical protein [Bacteroidota bacterium]
MKNERIINEFNRIRALGFIKSHRKHNTGIGKTFEDNLGIIENNQKDPDFEGFEVKTQRFLANSKITLFTKSPTSPEYANQLIREKYGELDKIDSVKIIHTSFLGDRYNTYLNKLAFKLKVDKRKKKVFLIIKDLSTDNIIERNIYYTFNDIIDSVQKLNQLIVVTAETEIRRKIEYFHYTKAVVFIGFNFQKFLNMIEKGRIQYDIRIGAYKSGKYKGRPHDHGSGFRIDRNYLAEVFEEVFEID